MGASLQDTLVAVGVVAASVTGALVLLALAARLRVGAVVIGIVTAAAMLMTFAQVRTLGASLLASAGILGLVVGIAPQQTLSYLLAGIQIAITEPIRLDDVVVVEGE